MLIYFDDVGPGDAEFEAAQTAALQRDWPDFSAKALLKST